MSVVKRQLKASGKRKAARKAKGESGRLRMRRKFTHLDFRVAPPQRCT